MSERNVSNTILQVLRPYASNFSGTLGRGDLVIPQREIPRLIHEILNAVGGTEQGPEVTDVELFQALTEVRRRPSIQDEVAELQRRFVVSKR